MSVMFNGLKAKFEIGEKQEFNFIYNNKLVRENPTKFHISRETAQKYFIRNLSQNREYSQKEFLSSTKKKEVMFQYIIKEVTNYIKEKSIESALGTGIRCSTIREIAYFIFGIKREIEVFSKKRTDVLIILLDDVMKRVYDFAKLEKQPCKACGKPVHEDGDFCFECSERGILTCTSCGTHGTHETITVFDDNGTARKLCKTCYDYNFTKCTCGQHIRKRQICRNCGYDRFLQSYSYRPTPKFFKKSYEVEPLFYGVEIETEIPRSLSKDKVINSVAEHLHFYFKEDGSLDNGIEFVSHPSSLAYHKEHTLAMIKTLRELNVKSDTTSTCGLHVHLAKEKLGNDQQEQKETIARLLILTDKLWSDLHKFTRREKHKLEQWANCYKGNVTERALMTDTAENILFNDITDRDKFVKNIYLEVIGKNVGRYKSINLNPVKTIEFRIFKGTIDDITFMSAVQLVDVLVNFAKRCTLKELFGIRTLRELVDNSSYTELKEYINKINL